jgi:hypothetical protein
VFTLFCLFRSRFSSLGESALLKISSEYGYGARGAGGVIPGGADLLFVVDLLKIGDTGTGTSCQIL